jgi:hypothetical protein
MNKSIHMRDPSNYDNETVFNLTLAHLVRQGRQAKYGSSCSYRTEDGLMCAVGCWIPDKYYKRSMEGLNIVAISEDFNSLEEYLGITKVEGRLELLTCLQALHDSSNNWNSENNGVSEKFWIEAKYTATRCGCKFDKAYIESLV